MDLEQHSLKSHTGAYVRDIWYAPGPEDTPHSLCLFLDAEHYVRDMGAPAVLQQLLTERRIPPAAFLFVSHVSGAARHADYVCSDSYTRLIAEDVLHWARAKNRMVQETGNIICGLSLSGLAAAYAAFHYPQTFSRVLCQSGSFWWLADNDVALAPTSARFWLSVGDAETDTEVSHPPTGLYQRISQIQGVEAAAQRFQSLGAEVHYNLYSGGHAIAPWRDELAPALEWLFHQ